MITITPFGAAGEVTGSSYLVETQNGNLLVDFGMFQGDKDDDARNIIPGKIHRTAISAVLLTHAHFDHSGRLPLLVREGYGGPIFSTPATREMAEVILSDSAHIQTSDFERKQRRFKKFGKKLNRIEQPLYDADDVIDTMKLFSDVPYETEVSIIEGVTAVFHEAGHMLGSTSITLLVQDEGAVKNVLFSGDLGPLDMPYLKDPRPPNFADVVVMEATYGDRDHQSLQDTLLQFAAIIQNAVQNKGKIFIPSFAIGRAQQIIYHLAQFIRNGLVPPLPIYLDSPMAIEAFALYKKYPTLLDRESREWLEKGQIAEDLATLELCASAQQSKEINDTRGPFIVIAGAGMCNAGRIVHHLYHNITDPNSHIVIVGYQARGSLGRYIVDGASNVSIMGDRKPVRAEVHTLGGFSAHAGQTELLNWYDRVASTKPLTILTHGEIDSRNALSEKITERFGVESIKPSYAQIIKL
ncbi:MAG: MBL fold metallo-hydrolase [Ignavibacteria bacterium]|nr:MBL fold metallo-hydrolase [Ignavibacteria bacterium]